MKGVAGVAAIVVVVAGAAIVTTRITAASSSAPLPVGYGFDGAVGWSHGVVKPRSVYFGVGGSLFVRGLSWTSWTQDAAVGRGMRWADNCVPTCAAGHYAKVPAELSLFGVRSRDGVRYFSRMILQWTIGARQYKSSYRWSRGPAPGDPPFWS